MPKAGCGASKQHLYLRQAAILNMLAGVFLQKGCRGNAGAWPSRVLQVAWQAGVLHYLQRVLCLKLTLLSLAFLLVLLFLADPCRAQQQAERCAEPLVSVSSQILV